MATCLKAVPTTHSQFALALITLDALRGDLTTLASPDADAVALRFAVRENEPAIAVTITLKPFEDATRTVFKLESGLLAGYRVVQVAASRESMSSSRRVVTAFILPENADV